ncbi:UDP-glucose:undecaprenyl-phosphate glucose-1-phosphate transferase [Rhodobacteraceae bacterium THAF1]|nr:UDP-glucose:undecaprenyl-phosphate glucose-1-phosphate transferase [Palleronia sp. THAF1]VDC17013.1 UDP-glucose:undecaprenyl-phosphate glucose-1-phosphate transferase [Rhodobacteraceae bacterium THAF1]
MLKFRTMHISEGGSVITAYRDPRVFELGRFLRAAKVDELPQFLNVLLGDMAVVGPRPEDPKIVSKAYTDWMRETLDVRPGITSPGALFYYSYGEDLVSAADAEGSYIRELLPPKLAIERAYLERATLVSDIGVILRTLFAIVGMMIGKTVPPVDQDIDRAERWWPSVRLAIPRPPHQS